MGAVNWSFLIDRSRSVLAGMSTLGPTTATITDPRREVTHRGRPETPVGCCGRPTDLAPGSHQPPQDRGEGRPSMETGEHVRSVRSRDTLTSRWKTGTNKTQIEPPQFGVWA